MIEPRNFDADLKAIFERHREPIKEPEKPKKQTLPFVDVNLRRFNVEKETEHGRRVVAFGITIQDAFRALDGRYKDSETVKYHVVPSEEI